MRRGLSSELRPAGFWRLAARRLVADWRAMSAVFLGALVAASLIAAAPVYLDALERQSVRNAVDSALERNGASYFAIEVSEDFIPLDSDALAAAGVAQSRALRDNAGALIKGEYRYLRTPFYAMSIPRLAKVAGSEDSDSEGAVPWVAQGFFHSLDGVEDRLAFAEGGRASANVVLGARGPTVEALVSARSAEIFGGLTVGEVVSAAPSAGSPVQIRARIVGVAEARDAEEPYWRNDADAFLDPRVPSAEGLVTRDSPPALGMIVDGDALAAALRAAFPDATADAVWRADVDSDILRTWSRGEMRAAMDGLRADLSQSLPGAFVFSGIDVMLARFGRQSFLSSVPLLLLMAVMAIAAVYFLFMIVAYLAPAREGDVALFRSRGASGWRLARLYLAEGAAMAGAAALVAPVLAIAAVWLAGFLPQFSHITGGAPLPVSLSWRPFAAAGGAAVLCLAVFVLPGAMGARAGVADQRTRSSRPPDAPFVQRHYIDVMLLAVGGALFWELRARGELASGGLFGQAGVNEALLIAPALLPIAVGLLFFRVFPMFVRYVGGESAALVHLMAGGALPALAVSVAFAELQAGDPTGWIPESAALAGVGAAYRFAAASGGLAARAFWTAAQAALIAAFFYMRPPDPDDYALIFICSVALAALVPAQTAFYMLAWLARRAPAWIAVSVWRMARNPTRYSWIALMLILNGGASVLAATVGATLDRAYEERIRYATGADIRIHSLQPYLGRRYDGGLEGRFGDIPEVETVSVALRGSGRVGAGGGGAPFAHLAVDADTFTAWHRDDFSDASLDETLAAVNAPEDAFGIAAPPDAREIRLWAKPASRYPRVFLWMTVQGADGRADTLSFGELGAPRWELMSADVPDSLKQPMRVLSIQINEPGFGAVGTVGELAFDDIQAVSRAGGGETVSTLEDFEGAFAWHAFPTTEAGGDEVSRTADNPRSGGGAALFAFGKETNRGVRGMYRADGGGFVRAVASSSFLAANGVSVGDSLLVGLAGGVVPATVSGEVDYFPTMNPAGGGFLIFDVRALMSYLDALSAAGGNAPLNEVFMTVRAGGGLAAFREANRRVLARGEAMGTAAALAALESDPLASAGWRMMSLVALGVVLLISSLGFAVYLLSSAGRGAGEAGALRSLGMSRAQTVGLAIAENAPVALIGLGIGTWTGFQMSRAAASAVAVAESGGQALPPFILTTDWTLIAPLYAALIVIFAICAATLGGRSGGGGDSRKAGRMEG